MPPALPASRKSSDFRYPNGWTADCRAVRHRQLRAHFSRPTALAVISEADIPSYRSMAGSALRAAPICQRSIKQPDIRSKVWCCRLRNAAVELKTRHSGHGLPGETSAAAADPL